MFWRLLYIAENRHLLVKVALALYLLGWLEHIPLAGSALNLHQQFMGEPFLSVLDVFTGGALARFSVLALGVYPYVIGRLAALIIHGPIRTELDKRRVRSLTLYCATVTAAGMGAFYLHILTRLGFRQPIGALLTFANIASLTAAAVLFVWLGEIFLSEFYGISLLVAANILAALPQYVFTGSRSAKNLLIMSVTFVMVITLQVVPWGATRKLPIGMPSVSGLPLTSGLSGLEIPLVSRFLWMRLVFSHSYTSLRAWR